MHDAVAEARAAPACTLVRAKPPMKLDACPRTLCCSTRPGTDSDSLASASRCVKCSKRQGRTHGPGPLSAVYPSVDGSVRYAVLPVVPR